jgi:hypothetical protein
VAFVSMPPTQPSDDGAERFLQSLSGRAPPRTHPQPVQLDLQLRQGLLVQHHPVGPLAHVVRPAALPPLPAQVAAHAGRRCGPQTFRPSSRAPTARRSFRGERRPADERAWLTGTSGIRLPPGVRERFSVKQDKRDGHDEE